MNEVNLYAQCACISNAIEQKKNKENFADCNAIAIAFFDCQVKDDLKVARIDGEIFLNANRIKAFIAFNF